MNHQGQHCIACKLSFPDETKITPEVSSMSILGSYMDNSLWVLRVGYIAQLSGYAGKLPDSTPRASIERKKLFLIKVGDSPNRRYLSKTCDLHNFIYRLPCFQVLEVQSHMGISLNQSQNFRQTNALEGLRCLMSLLSLTW